MKYWLDESLDTLANKSEQYFVKYCFQVLL